MVWSRSDRLSSSGVTVFKQETVLIKFSNIGTYRLTVRRSNKLTKVEQRQRTVVESRVGK